MSAHSFDLNSSISKLLGINYYHDKARSSVKHVSLTQRSLVLSSRSQYALCAQSIVIVNKIGVVDKVGF